jgi:carbon storage regulator
MLVLSRKTGERIVIADSIVVTVLEVKGSHVRLGIQAPPRFRVRREELLVRADRLAPGSSPAGAEA